MKRKPQEKLSDRFTNLFLTFVLEYDTFYFELHTKKTFEELDEWSPANFAQALSKICIDTLAEYEPEDIE